MNKINFELIDVKKSVYAIKLELKRIEEYIQNQEKKQVEEWMQNK